MRLPAVLLGLVVGCGSTPSAPPPSSSPASTLSVLGRVGDKPHAFANLDLRQKTLLGYIDSQYPEVREQLTALVSRCKFDIDKVDHLRVALGEPLRIAAELDGQVDAKMIDCAFHDLLVRFGVQVRDRPGGVSFDYMTTSGTPGSDAVELAARCTDRCAVLRVGPATRSIWLAVDVDDHVTIHISGTGLEAGLAAFAAAARDIPVLAPAQIREDHGTLSARLVDNVLDGVGIALALRSNLLEAFSIPSSSMEPTLHIGDHLFVIKGPLARQISPGDLLAYTTDEDRDYLKRYIGAPGQTITESEAGLAIDGKTLPNEVVDAHYVYDDGEAGRARRNTGTLVREHLGARSYLTVRTGPPRDPGPWRVPADAAFFVGDNRNNSNDSRYNPATLVARIKGRAVVIWWALKNGAPDWDRIGAPID